MLFLGALRHDAVLEGQGHPLFFAIGADDPDPNVITPSTVAAALSSERFWSSLRDRFVQTNETSRAVAWLWPAMLAGCDAGARPITLAEVGCAAGLNLVADALPATWLTAPGEPLPVVRTPNVVRRVGFDRRPLRVSDADSLSWMRACIWPGERDRLARFDAGVAAFLSAPPELVTADAREIPQQLQAVLTVAPSAGLLLAFQTIVRDYFDAATAEAYDAGMRALLLASPGSVVLVDLELSLDQAPDAAHPAALTAHVAGEGGRVERLMLGHTHFHPTEVIVNDAAVARFRALAGPR
jgi:hypothetical protein